MVGDSGGGHLLTKSKFLQLQLLYIYIYISHKEAFLPPVTEVKLVFVKI
jgi:hypothetical protein